MHLLCHTLVLGDRVIIKKEERSICGRHFLLVHAHSFFPKAISVVKKKEKIGLYVCVCVCACMSACMVNQLLCNPFEILLTETCSESGGVCVERISRGFLLPGDGLQL